MQEVSRNKPERAVKSQLRDGQVCRISKAARKIEKQNNKSGFQIPSEDANVAQVFLCCCSPFTQRNLNRLRSAICRFVDLLSHHKFSKDCTFVSIKPKIAFKNGHGNT